MRQIPGDLILAFGLLTRLPMPRLDIDPSRSARAAWAWSLVGAAVGAIGAGVGAGAAALGLPPGIAAGLSLVAMTFATGGLHEDGLADTADGLWGGATRARRLEIMRDSRVGAYGVLALVLVLLLRFAAILALAESGAWTLLIGAAALSRAGMAILMAGLRNARCDGLSQSTGRPPFASVAGALGLAILTGLLLGLPAICWLAAALVLGWLTWQAQSKLGGQTGDILGAGCLLAETAALIAAV